MRLVLACLHAKCAHLRRKNAFLIFLFFLLTLAMLFFFVQSDVYGRLEMHLLHNVNFNVRLCFWRKTTSFWRSAETQSDRTFNLSIAGSKIVLVWTTILEDEADVKAASLACPHAKCHFTTDKRFQEAAHAVIFHGQDLCMHDIPTVRSSEQRYVFYGYEPPTFKLADLDKTANFFNWTASFRLDSDVFVPYGKLVRTYSQESKSNSREFREKFENKTRMVAWFVRRCHALNQREIYAHTLQKYLPVDIYGDCGPFQCQQWSVDCDRMLDNEYFFYLAFENAICKDYVTEKFWRALENNVIPIVLKRSIYEHIVPKHSFIAADDFDTIEDLANHLMMLKTKPDLYRQYMQWNREGFRVERVKYPQGYCNICEKLWRDEPRKVYNDFAKWWIQDAQCDATFVKKQTQTSGYSISDGWSMYNANGMLINKANLDCGVTVVNNAPYCAQAYNVQASRKSLLHERMFLWFLCNLFALLLVGAVVFKIYLFVTCGRYVIRRCMRGKVVLITGGTAGIGKETARELARVGAKVYMLCRNVQKAECVARELIAETRNKEIFVLECDLADLNSVRKCAENFLEKDAKIDILINNAGISAPVGTKQAILTADKMEITMQSNHFGHFLLTNLLLERIKKSAPSRIVNVSSTFHALVKDFNVNSLNSFNPYKGAQPYAWSKLCQVLFTKTLSKKLDGTGVTVNVLHPGFVDTSIFDGVLSRPWLRYIALFFLTFSKTSKEGAQTSLFCAIDPKLQSVSGHYFADCNVAATSVLALDEQLGDQLWEKSCELTKYQSA